MDDDSVQRVPLQVSRGCVVASIQLELTDAGKDRFRKDLLGLVQSSGARGVILEVSGLAVIDVEDFGALRKTMAMVEVMGARPIIAGLRPGVVSSLVDLNADIDGVVATLDLDDAFRMMEQAAPGARADPPGASR